MRRHERPGPRSRRGGRRRPPRDRERFGAASSPAIAGARAARSWTAADGVRSGHRCRARGPAAPRARRRARLAGCLGQGAAQARSARLRRWGRLIARRKAGTAMRVTRPVQQRLPLPLDTPATCPYCGRRQRVLGLGELDRAPAARVRQGTRLLVRDVPGRKAGTMSRKRRRPPWPLKRWPERGELLVHAVCREWDLPCPCCACFAAENPEQRDSPSPTKG